MAESRGRVRVEPGPRRVRVEFGGQTIADTTRPLYVWEKPYYPTYYLPLADVDAGVLVETGEVERSPSRGTSRVHDVKVADRTATGAARVFEDSPLEEVRGTVRLRFRDMDAWFEEDEEIFVHPRDPYKRVDMLRSSRHVRVSIDGVVVAETDQPTFLFETGLPRRTYLPPTHVRRDLLVPSDHHTECPYKGRASYHSVRIGDDLHEDVVWHYPSPLRESTPIGGLYCFYDERVDVEVDGELQERPRTPFS